MLLRLIPDLYSQFGKNSWTFLLELLEAGNLPQGNEIAAVCLRVASRPGFSD